MEVEVWKFVVGVLAALLCGIVNNMGNLLQKKAVNDYLQSKLQYIQLNGGEGQEIRRLSTIDLSMKTLIFNKTWAFGFLMQLVIATAFFILAQTLIGPTLTPALGSIGLVVLVFASCLLQEKLTWYEYFGIFLMTGSVVLLGFSNMVIDQSKTDFLQGFFMMRVAIYTLGILAMSIFCKLWAWRKDRWEGTMLATNSGLLIALSNYWVSPFTATIGGLFSHSENPTYTEHSIIAIVALFVVSAVLVIGSNVWAIVERQLAFRVGNAATMIPISHVPSHLSSPIIYSLVFFLPQPQSFSLAFMWIGILGVLISSFIFGKREATFSQPNPNLKTEQSLYLEDPLAEI
eukprot:Phypoly_transcript_10067.p1 GENE.Phypoly_transcript_10067~~Phypoly_transcript_10067.p1  ORF type:complete len:372 (+),score=47.58 Phypoly_transcript_10067:82-1116(+)